MTGRPGEPGCPRTYRSRSSAVRAARNACRVALKSPIFSAYEGPDYIIHSERVPLDDPRWPDDRFYFRLRGPALEASEGVE